MRRTALYRHFDAEGRLLYVGITDGLTQRDKQHAHFSSWHDDVEETKTQWCLSRQHALDLEAVAIRHEKPIHNIACNPAKHKTKRKKVAPKERNPEVDALVLEIAAFRERLDMPETAFGLWVMNDPNLMRNLRAGRDLRWQTICMIREKMEGAA